MKIAIKIVALVFATLFAANSLFAKNINLFDQPANNAKVVGTIDPEAGIILIYTPKDTTWIKVADPRNGNVGWVKNADLGSQMGPANFSFHLISTGSGPHHYQIMQFGSPQPISSQNTQNLLKQLEEHQKTMQKDIQKIMRDIYEAAEKNLANFPMVVPVAVPPHENEKPKK